MAEVRSEDIARRLGEHMRAWRATHGVTLEEAGERIGVDLQAWHRWESNYRDGRNPTLRSMMRIAAAMETDLPTLMADLYWPSKDESTQ